LSSQLYAADTHVFHVFWPFLPEAADARQQAGSFIRGLREGGGAVRGRA
jgi:hypothetical protein